jgi:hypothetical protein
VAYGIDLQRDVLGEARENALAADAQLASLESLAHGLRQRLTSAYGVPAVTAHYDDDGVLASLHIDDGRRSELTEEQLVEQLSGALASGPAPRRTPDALLALLEGSQPDALEPAEHRAAGGAMTLLTVGRKPIGIRTRPGWILSEPSSCLSSTIVALARRVATASPRTGA